ncbi:RNA-binding [Fusarium beomiforme]|uniref:RNA-binding n=1 Tax=Fusarium beomiforme TaxID=44412 RepID=A0A9P5AUY2_9HYPO|nr:RNA-binding [Fusarium beomiforme]
MLFPEEDAPLLKAWIVKRIENTSDADADVLAEYVIALLKHDGDADAVRKLCEQEIPDFLSEDPKAFLDDVFQAIAYKSYVPGAPPAPKIGAEPEPLHQSLTESTTPNGSRKRGFYDRDDYDPQHVYEAFNHDGRVQKQPRRGGRGGRGDETKGGRPGASMHNLPPRPDMPFDPKVMEAFLQMGSMGMPYPGMPNFPQQSFGGGRNQLRRRGRCRDFDTKGFCSRGSTCPYDHGNESIFVPPGTDEYDPSDPFAILANTPNNMNPWANLPEAGRGGRGGRRNRGTKKGGSRAPFSAEGPNYDRTKSTIVIENIPEDSFSEEQVRKFFSQFGNIQEVSMQPYKHLAIVKYDKWGSANAAYQSPKVIFDNRFVKVFWYKDKTDTLPASAPLQEGNWSGDPMAREDDELEPEIDMEEFRRKQEEEQKKHQEREAQRAKIEQERQEVVKKHQELLARHREENEKLQAKLASQRGEDEDANSSGTNMLRAKLAALEQEAKMLGLDPNAEEESNSSWASRGGYRGRGNFRARGRGRGSFRGRGGGNMHAAYAQYSIDNRPKKLAITGVDFTAPDKDEMLRHFLLNLGEFESVDTAPETTYVSFQDRKTAEKFYYSLNGKELPGVEGRLELAWVNTPLPSVKTASNDDAPRHGGENDAMADFDDQPGREKSAEPQREERAVNMDYEVAEEDTW